MTGTDVAGLISAINSRDDSSFGENWIWIIGLLIVAGIFGGNSGIFGNGNSSGVTEEYIANQFTQRDINNLNTAMLQGNTGINTAVLENRYNCSQNASNTQMQVLENRYANSIAFANAQKDTLLSQNAIQSDIASCCCENRLAIANQTNAIENAIHSEGETTRALITQNRIEQLQTDLQSAQLTLAQANQTQNILNSLGNYYPKTGVNPYYAYNTGYTYGTTIV